MGLVGQATQKLVVFVRIFMQRDWSEVRDPEYTSDAASSQSSRTTTGYTLSQMASDM